MSPPTCYRDGGHPFNDPKKPLDAGMRNRERRFPTQPARNVERFNQPMSEMVPPFHERAAPASVRSFRSGHANRGRSGIIEGGEGPGGFVAHGWPIGPRTKGAVCASPHVVKAVNCLSTMGVE